MNTINQTFNHPNYRDISGVCASLLCVLHCLAMPFLVTVIPTLAATEHQTHSVFAVVILLIGTLAFVPGYRKHQKIIIPASGAAGVATIIAAAMLPEMENGETIETLMVVAGGVTLIGAHLRNAYWCQFCRTCGDESCAISGNRNTSIGFQPVDSHEFADGNNDNGTEPYAPTENASPSTVAIRFQRPSSCA